MLLRDDRGIYRVAEFERLPWLLHGFGTAHSTAWPPEPLASANQIHSSTVLRVAEVCSGRLGPGDALITNRPGTTVGIRTADCVPILLIDPENRAVAAVHAGWRGTVADIAGETVRQLAAAYGSRPETLLAAIGPAIGGCCFEVGPEVAVEFQELFPERTDLDRKTKVDLELGNFRRLTAAGLRPESIFRGAPCTFCTPSEFHSWRREKSAGRMVSAAGIL